MIQEFIAFGLLGVAVWFLFKKFFGNKKSKGKCGTDCGCK